MKTKSLQQMIWRGLLVSLPVLFFSTSALAWGGDLLWEKRVDPGQDQDARAQVVKVVGSQVVVAGTIDDEIEGGFDWLVQSYDFYSGALLWEDTIDREGFSRPYSIASDGGVVYVAGYLANEEDEDDNGDFYLRAYNSHFGLPLWEDQQDYEGGFDRVTALEARHGRVFAVGIGEKPGYQRDWWIRSYSAYGSLLWSKTYGAPDHDDWAFDAKLDDYGWSLTVVGDGGATPYQGAVVRSYSTFTGQLLWEDEFHPGGGTHFDSIRVDGYYTFVAGSLASEGKVNEKAFVRAYQTYGGGLLWSREVPSMFDDPEHVWHGTAYDALAVAPSYWGNLVIAGGEIGYQHDEDSGSRYGLLSAYNYWGQKVWEDIFDVTVEDGGNDIDVMESYNGRLIVAGEPYDAISGDSAADWMIRSYNAANGQLSWQKLVDGGDYDSIGSDSDHDALAVAYGRAFVCGEVEDTDDDGDWLVQSYSVY